MGTKKIFVKPRPFSDRVKGNYTLLKKARPLSYLKDRTLRQLARIVTQDLNPLILAYTLRVHHFDSDRVRLGLAFNHDGRKTTLTDKELQKFVAYLKMRTKNSSPHTPADWEKSLDMLETVVKGRQLYERTREFYRPKKRGVRRISDVAGYTEFLRLIVNCINTDVNPAGGPRRYKERTYELASCALEVFSIINRQIFLTAEQIKGRIEKNLPLVKR